MTGSIMTEVAENIGKVLARVRRAEEQSGRSPGSVTVLAVSKTKPVDAMREAFAAGQRDFGENYLQEALQKQPGLADLAMVWHFIGPIQRNKTRDIAAHFDWVHSVDRLVIAERLSAQRPEGMAPLQVCLQVNVDDEESKAGCRLEELPALVRALQALPGISLRGLMCIPRPGNSEAFRVLAKTLTDLQATIPGLEAAGFHVLSMGMSDDLEEAVAAGSTMVRIGTAIFGARHYPAATSQE